MKLENFAIKFFLVIKLLFFFIFLNKKTIQVFGRFSFNTYTCFKYHVIIIRVVTKYDFFSRIFFALKILKIDLILLFIGRLLLHFRLNTLLQFVTSCLMLSWSTIVSYRYNIIKCNGFSVLNTTLVFGSGFLIRYLYSM